jgi:hypothetical protein
MQQLHEILYAHLQFPRAPHHYTSHPKDPRIARAGLDARHPQSG